MKKKPLTVGKLKRLLKDVPDYLEVRLSSDTGVDQGLGTIIVEDACRFDDYFDIYANDYEADEMGD